MRLPDDVLAEVFGHTCVSRLEIVSTYPPIISRDLPQCTLQLVCKAWRSVILSRPRLWSVICLGGVFEASTAAVLTHQARLLELWLSRSKSYPLEIVLFFVHAPEDGDEDVVMAEALVIGKILSVAGRWRSLSAQCHGRVMHQLAPALSASLPSLVHASLYIHRAIDIGQDESLCLTDFPSSMRLEDIAIQGYVRLRKWGSGMQSTALRTFIYQPYFKTGDFTLSLDNLYELFASCPALKNAMALVYNRFPFQKTVQGKQREHLILDNLERLRVSAFDPSDASEADVGPLLDVLTIPKLVDFHLMETVQRLVIRENGDWNHLSDFLKRSNAPICRCSLFGIPITSERQVECLEMLPYVEELELAGVSFDEYMVSRLCWNPKHSVGNGGNVLPVLSSLKVGGGSTRFSSVPEIVHMIHSRIIVPDYVDDGTDLEVMELWAGLPQDVLTHFTLYQCGLWDEEGAPSIIGEELAQNSLIKFYVAEKLLSVAVLN